MKRAEKRPGAASFVCNLLLAVLVGYVCLSYFLPLPFGAEEVRGTEAFRYFTTDSNILAAVAGLCLLPQAWARMKGRRQAPAGGILLLKFVGTAAVTVTFLTVLLFLGPLFGYETLYIHANFYLHLLCPLLAMVSFLFLDGGPRLRLAESLLGVLPVLVYGSVYFVMVVVLGPERGGWPDFYGFNIGGMWPVAALGMPLAGWLAALLLGKLRRREPSGAEIK